MNRGDWGESGIWGKRRPPTFNLNFLCGEDSRYVKSFRMTLRSTDIVLSRRKWLGKHKRSHRTKLCYNANLLWNKTNRTTGHSNRADVIYSYFIESLVLRLKITLLSLPWINQLRNMIWLGGKLEGGANPAFCAGVRTAGVTYHLT